MEKDLEATRLRFQAAKSSYQNFSTQLIDKAGLLEMKRTIDFGTHLGRIRQMHDAFNRGRVGQNMTADTVLEE
jgi:hypothetical protein